MVSALLEYSPTEQAAASTSGGWLRVAPPRAPRPKSVEELVAERRALLSRVAGGMCDQRREGDLAELSREHAELAVARQRANGEILD